MTNDGPTSRKVYRSAPGGEAPHAASTPHAKPSGALRLPSPRPDSDTRCDPRMVQRGTALVETNARAEGARHARARRMRVRQIPGPFVGAYVDGFLAEWHRMNEEADHA